MKIIKNGTFLRVDIPQLDITQLRPFIDLLAEIIAEDFLEQEGGQIYD